MNHYILIWSVCTFVESHVREEIPLEELVRQTGFSLAHIGMYSANAPESR